MSHVNLLPPEIKKGRQTRRRTVLVVVGGLVVLGVIILFWLAQGVRLNGVNDDIEAQNTTNAELQQQINALQQYSDLQSEAQQQEQLLASAYAGEVAYSGVLVDVSKAIPSDMYLQTFTSALNTTAPAPGTETTTTSFVGTMAFTGATLHFDSIKVWLMRLEEVRGWANPWTSNVSSDPTTPGSFLYDTSVDLTQDALTERGKAGEAASGG